MWLCRWLLLPVVPLKESSASLEFDWLVLFLRAAADGTYLMGLAHFMSAHLMTSPHMRQYITCWCCSPEATHYMWAQSGLNIWILTLWNCLVDCLSLWIDWTVEKYLDASEQICHFYHWVYYGLENCLAGYRLFPRVPPVDFILHLAKVGCFGEQKANHKYF